MRPSCRSTHRHCCASSSFVFQCIQYSAEPIELYALLCTCFYQQVFVAANSNAVLRLVHVNYSKTCRFPLTQTHLLKPLSLIFRNLNPRCSHSGWEWHGLAEAEGAVCVREVLRKGFELCRLIRKASYTSKKRQKLLKRLRPKCGR